MGRPVTWLHLSDIHLGQKGLEVWHQVEQDFFSSVKKVAPRFDCPDFVLITGDLAFSGTPEQYKLVDVLLEGVRKGIRSIWKSADPLIVPVPGNHDVAWVPEAKSEFGQYAVFDQYAASDGESAQVRSLNKQLWDGDGSPIVRALFPGYLPWSKRALEAVASRKGVELSSGCMPGDVTVLADLPGTFPLAIVGLNSAWLQYTDSDFEKRLAIPLRQFHSALPTRGNGNPLDCLEGRRSILLMHHPVEWQHPKYQIEFRTEVLRPDRFDVCLYGHMHEATATSVAQDGGIARLAFQGPSLCGLEHFGRRNESRAFGYAFGRMHPDGAVYIAPFMRRMSGGAQEFLWDQRFGSEADNLKGVCLRAPRAMPPARTHEQSGEEYVDRLKENEAKDAKARETITRGQQEELYAAAENGVRIFIVRGDIRDAQADVIVSSDDTNLSAQGGLSRRILDQAGQRVQEECKSLGARGVPHGHVAATSGGALPHCRAILHAAVIDRTGVGFGYPTETEIRSVIRHSLSCASAFGAKHIAMPIVGGGTAAKFVTPWEAIELIVDEFFEFIYRRRGAGDTLRELALYVYKPTDVTGDIKGLLDATRARTKLTP